jgi:hypothetical protein
MDDSAFIHKFETAAWPMEQWHHKEHIKIAYLYLIENGFDGALTKLRSGILALNAFHQVPEGPTRGYHETMTQAWLRLVHVTLCEYGQAETADLFYEQHPELSEKKALRLFYSADRMMDPRAKFEFLESDLAPLPRPRKALEADAAEILSEDSGTV